jgi:hypothetical protein
MGNSPVTGSPNYDVIRKMEAKSTAPTYVDFLATNVGFISQSGYRLWFDR